VLERHDYLPFGEECTTGVCANNPGHGNNQRAFHRQERDKRRGSIIRGSYLRASTEQTIHDRRSGEHMDARSHPSHPEFGINRSAGRWNIHVHGAHNVEGLADPQRWNRYAYGRNNPFRYVDTDGGRLVLAPDQRQPSRPNLGRRSPT